MTSLEREQWQQNTQISNKAVSSFGLFGKGEQNTPLAGDGGDNLVTPEFVWAVSKMRCCVICDPKQL